MLLGNITPPLLVIGALGLSAMDAAVLMQAVFFMAGIATIVQAYPIGPVGGRLPIVMGTTVAFVPAIILVGREHGLATVFGACLVASVVEIGLGFGVGRLKRFFPPLVTGVVVMLIGLTLIPVGMDYVAGGVVASDYGTPVNLAIAGVVFVVALLLNRLTQGFLSHASLLLGVVAGYAMALVLGRVDFTGLGATGGLSVPRLFSFGLEFDLGAILLMGLVYVITTIETIGDISGTLAAVDRDPTPSELRGGLVADGVMSGLAALFSAFPNTSYSQNVGLVHFTGVASRHVTAVSGVILLCLGLIPVVGAVLATMPAPVIGGGGLIMFGMIFASGFAIVDRGADLTRRNMVVLAISIGVGLGIELRPDVLRALPGLVRTLVGSGLVSGGMTALLLNAVLPEEPPRRGAA